MRGLKTLIVALIALSWPDIQAQDLWSKVIVTSSGDRALSTAVRDVDGSIVVVGEAASSEAFTSPIRPYGGGNLDGFVAKYNESGTLLWATYIGAAGEDACGDVVLDDQGNIYVTGYVETTLGAIPANLPGNHQGLDKKDAFLLKLDPNGAVQYFHTWGSSKRDHGLRLAINGNSIYMIIAADFNGLLINGTPPSGSLNDGKMHYVLMSLQTSTGEEAWHWFLGSEANDLGVPDFNYGDVDLSGADVEADASGVYVALNLAGRDLRMRSSSGPSPSDSTGISTDSAAEPFLLSFTLTGALNWYKMVSEVATESAYLRLALDCDAIYCSYSYGSGFGNTVYLSLNKLNKADGNAQYEKHIQTNTSTMSDSKCHDLESDGRGRVIMVGEFKGQLDYATTSGLGSLTAANGSNFFLLNFRASDGLVQSNHSGGGIGEDGYFGLDVSNSGDYSLVGYGELGDEITGVNVGNVASLNSSKNIMIRNRTVLGIDIGSCCGSDDLISSAMANPTMICSGQSVSLSATGTYDDLTWYRINGSIWTAISGSLSVPTGGSAQVAAIATKACGNRDTSAFIMVYHDTIPPVAISQNITVNLDVSGNASITASEINNGSSDNCSIQSMSLDVSTFNVSNLGPNAVTLTITDEAGITSTSVATVTVLPYTPATECHTGGTMTFPAGSWIIAMDNITQPGKFYGTIPLGYPNAGSAPSGNTPFNLKAYGLINALLQNEVHLYWAINSAKAKNGIDINVDAFRRFPLTAAAGNFNFLSGPMVIHPSDTAAAKSIIQLFGNEVKVYQTTVPKIIEYTYKLSFKPKVLLLSNGGINNGEWQYEKHAALFTIAGIPNSVWEASKAADVSLDGNSCYSMAAEAHWKDGEDPTNGTAYTASVAETVRVRNFVAGGGNFLSQCAGIEPYENNEHFHTSNGIIAACGSNCAPYTDAQAGLDHTEYFPVNPIMQINGALNNDPTGTFVAIRENGGSYAPLLKQLITKNNAEKDQVAEAIKLTPADKAGGFVFYLGGHDYREQAGTDKPYDISYVNGIRIFLNAFLTPPDRPLCASMAFCNDCMSNDTEAPQPEVMPLQQPLVNAVLQCPLLQPLIIVLAL